MPKACKLVCNNQMFYYSFHNDIVLVQLKKFMQLYVCNFHQGMPDSMLYRRFLWMKCIHLWCRINLFFTYYSYYLIIKYSNSFLLLILPYLIFYHQNHFQLHLQLALNYLCFKDYQTIFLIHRLFKFLVSIQDKCLHADLMTCHHIQRL